MSIKIFLPEVTDRLLDSLSDSSPENHSEMGWTKVYELDRSKGRDENGGFIVTVTDTETDETKTLSPKPSQKLINHCPNGFNWGYGGSGPSQLALAILLDVLGDKDLSLEHYQDFKWEVVAKLSDISSWKIKEGDVRIWVLDQIRKG